MGIFLSPLGDTISVDIMAFQRLANLFKIEQLEKFVRKNSLVVQGEVGQQTAYFRRAARQVVKTLHLLSRVQL
jgi:hypothetical protein